jgi:hypothetical protein
MKEDVIQIFVKKDDISLSIDSNIDLSIADRFRNIYPTSSFDPSRVTDCPRRMIYRVNGNKQDFFDTYMDSISVSMAKTRWLDFFDKCKFIRKVERNLTIADCHYNISGCIDATLKIDNIIYITKIQSVNDFDFSQIKSKGAFKKHVIEVVVYLWLAEKKDGLLFYENKNTHEHLTFHVSPYQSIIKSVTEKCTNLIDCKMKGIIPKRPYKTKDGNECSKCEYRKTCWEDKN